MNKSPKALAAAALISVVSNFVFPQYAFAGLIIADLKIVEAKTSGYEEYQVGLPDPEGLVTTGGHTLVQTAYPDTPLVGYSQWVLTTAYSSTVDQTDDSPFITATGSHVRDGIVACNFLSFGTRVRFPQIYGDKIFIVDDRMAKRNSHKIDIWMETREEALQFGARVIKVDILLN